MMKLVILALALALAAVAAFPSDHVVPETLPTARRQPAQVLFDVGQHGRHTHRFGNQLSTMLRDGDSTDQCEQVVEDEMGVIKESMETDKTFLNSATGKITKCLEKFSERLELLKKQKTKFETAMREIETQEKAAAEAVSQLDAKVKAANVEVMQMGTMASEFGSGTYTVKLNKGPTIDTTQNVANGKRYAQKYFDGVLKKLTSDLETCQKKQVCQIVKLKAAIEGVQDGKRKPREGAIVHGSYLKCAIKNGGLLAQRTDAKKCSDVGVVCPNKTDGICQDANGQCSAGVIPDAKDTVGWGFTQPATLVCGRGTKPCQDFLDDCAYKSFMAKMSTGFYSVTWKKVTVNRVDATGKVTEESQSVDEWSAGTTCLQTAVLEHKVQANTIGSAGALSTRVATERKKLHRPS